MEQLISRQQAIDALADYIHNVDKVYSTGKLSADDCRDAAQSVLTNLPSAEEESFEWCDTCKEYDQEKHCCHRWTKVIRNTVEELKVVRCKDCKYAEYIDDVQSLWCTECGNGRTVAPYDFCSYGERRTDG